MITRLTLSSIASIIVCMSTHTLIGTVKGISVDSSWWGIEGGPNVPVSRDKVESLINDYALIMQKEDGSVCTTFRIPGSLLKDETFGATSLPKTGSKVLAISFTVNGKFFNDYRGHEGQDAVFEDCVPGTSIPQIRGFYINSAWWGIEGGDNNVAVDPLVIKRLTTPRAGFGTGPGESNYEFVIPASSMNSASLQVSDPYPGKVKTLAIAVSASVKENNYALGKQGVPLNLRGIEGQEFYFCNHDRSTLKAYWGALDLSKQSQVIKDRWAAAKTQAEMLDIIDGAELYAGFLRNAEDVTQKVAGLFQFPVTPKADTEIGMSVTYTWYRFTVGWNLSIPGSSVNDQFLAGKPVPGNDNDKILVIIIPYVCIRIIVRANQPVGWSYAQPITYRVITV